MATTEDAIVDRARAVLAALEYDEAQGLDLTRLAAGTHDRRFTVGYLGQTPLGQIGLQEEARGALLISLTAATNEDHQPARRALWVGSRAVLAALVEDGAVTSGEYAVEDAGRSVEIVAPPGAAFLECRMRVPINFEAALT